MNEAKNMISLARSFAQKMPGGGQAPGMDSAMSSGMGGGMSAGASGGMSEGSNMPGKPPQMGQ